MQTKAPINETDKRSESRDLVVKPLTEVEHTRNRAVGRPSKLVMPDLPRMAMTDVERDLFEFFLSAYQEQYPDLVPTDQLLLHLAAIEYIKYLRVAAWELETGKVITMSRQHPGTNLRALLDQMSVTRRARIAKAKPENEDEAELRELFMSMSSGQRKK